MTTENLEKAKVTTSSGKDVKDTGQLSGESKITKAEKATNETVKYSTGSAPATGPLGGMNTRH